MYNKWSRYTAIAVQTGFDENGNRLLSLFARDYKTLTGNDICPSCKDFDSKFKSFLKKAKEMAKSEQTNSGFVLKKKYEGIALGFGSPIVVTNENLTDEYASTLIQSRGIELFSEFPENYEDLLKDTQDPRVKELVDNNTAAQLKEIATGAGVEDLSGNKTDIAERIVAAQSKG